MGNPGGTAGHGTGQELPARTAATDHTRQQDPTGPQPQQGPVGEGPLLGLRSAIILMLGILVATAAGVLTYSAQQDPATAALAAGGAFAGGVLFFQKIIAG
ncbi:hypothetical protein DTB58_39700 [Streptomyces griseus]|nr:hypothetical protein [Streptomyces griseus]